MKFSGLLLAGALVCAGSAFAAPICPTTSSTTGADPSGCGVLITDGPSGATLTLTGIGPYDGSEDETVGLINNTGKALTSLTLSSPSGSDAFGFEGDGIQTFTSLNGVAIPTGGATGYEGPNQTYDISGVVGGDGTLIINFTTALADGASTYFSLEGAPSLSLVVGPSTPEPASMALIGSGMLALGGMALRRRRKQ